MLLRRRVSRDVAQALGPELTTATQGTRPADQRAADAGHPDPTGGVSVALRAGPPMRGMCGGLDAVEPFDLLRARCPARGEPAERGADRRWRMAALGRAAATGTDAGAVRSVGLQQDDVDLGRRVAEQLGAAAGEQGPGATGSAGGIRRVRPAWRSAYGISRTARRGGRCAQRAEVDQDIPPRCSSRCAPSSGIGRGPRSNAGWRPGSTSNTGWTRAGWPPPTPPCPVAEAGRRGQHGALRPRRCQPGRPHLGPDRRRISRDRPHRAGVHTGSAVPEPG